jgi:hypothetical protein
MAGKQHGGQVRGQGGSGVTVARQVACGAVLELERVMNFARALVRNLA